MDIRRSKNANKETLMEKMHMKIYRKKHDYDCMVCGSELLYSNEYSRVKCVYCHGDFQANVMCKSGHYICDSCHSADANEVIDKYCKTTDKINPMEMAMDLMKAPQINIHGPEHHFLVPAVLITSYYNLIDKKEEKPKKLTLARKRARHIKGGFCGFYGNCGAAVGTGLYLSIVNETTPLSKKGWGLANKMTGSSLISIGEIGGPRCCKRNLFTALKEAAIFTEEYLNIRMYDYEIFQPQCNFHSKNNECIRLKCPYF
ncbi:MAG: DUF5714 domain-containing protein [Tissierellaceae bacterium]